MDHRRFILIVDKNRNSGFVMSSMLEAWGYRTDIVHTLEGALDLLKEVAEKPHLILVEILHFREQSFTFPAHVHWIQGCEKIPVVAHSVLTDRATVTKAATSGFTDFIVRPTEPEILRDKISRILLPSSHVSRETFLCPVKERGDLILDVEIDALNEFGLEAYGPIFLQVGTVVRLHSPTLSKLEMNEVRFRVTGCEDSKHPQNRYKIGFSYVALSPHHAQLLRQYAISGGHFKKTLPEAG